MGVLSSPEKLPSVAATSGKRFSILIANVNQVDELKYCEQRSGRPGGDEGANQS